MSLPRALSEPEKRLLRAIASLTGPATIYRPAVNVYRCGLRGVGARQNVWWALQDLGLIHIHREPTIGPVRVEPTPEGRAVDAALRRRASGPR
ncbi:hypothetical protein ACIBEJ_00730 [Nonomuraea sp. NPDC050790]|uniref:hypothetical protein n=1 Tax=Nonomuraea sp. NPDC050790 TaxID=3364371 RepID=UPI0037B092EE